MTTVNTAVSPGSAAEALGMLRSAMGHLSTADATQLAVEEQARCLQALEQVQSMGAAARTSILAAFASGQGYSADADYSLLAWLIHKTRITKGAAVGYTAWVRRAAMRRLIAADLLPQRAGQPVKALVHISLADLMRLDGAAAQAFTCDASVTPVVTAEVNPATLDDLVRLCAQLDRLHHCGDSPAAPEPAAPDPGTTRAQDALEQAIIGKAVDLLSGPGGLASFLRRRQLGARLAGPSLPLDVGCGIPAAIRRAVILRDQHCRFPGGYFL